MCFGSKLSVWVPWNRTGQWEGKGCPVAGDWNPKWDAGDQWVYGKKMGLAGCWLGFCFVSVNSFQLCTWTQHTTCQSWAVLIPTQREVRPWQYVLWSEFFYLKLFFHPVFPFPAELGPGGRVWVGVFLFLFFLRVHRLVSALLLKSVGVLFLLKIFPRGCREYSCPCRGIALLCLLGSW